MTLRLWAKVNPPLLRLRRQADIVALGDSNTLISYLPPWSRDRWTTIVASKTGRSVLNLGRDGATLRAAIEAGELERALGGRPSDVLVAYAVNDSTRERAEDFAQLLRDTVARIKSAGARPWLVTGVWLDYPAHYSTNRRNDEIEPFNQVIRAVARELEVGLIDVAAAMQRETAAGNWDLRIRNGALDASRDAGKAVESRWWNNVHLNRNGCAVVADDVVRRSVRKLFQAARGADEWPTPWRPSRLKRSAWSTRTDLRGLGVDGREDNAFDVNVETHPLRYLGVVRRRHGHMVRRSGDGQMAAA